MRSPWIRKIGWVLLLLFLAGGWTTRVHAGEEQGTVPASPAAPDSVLVTQLEAHDRAIRQELRQVKRDLAALSQRMDEPGLRDIMAGIGYILGLFGTAAFVAARRQAKAAHGD
jgi:hypothetical protein